MNKVYIGYQGDLPVRVESSRKAIENDKWLVCDRIEEHEGRAELVNGVILFDDEILSEVKAAKLSELSGKFSAAEADAHLTSSLGIVINAGEKANRDIDGLVKLMEAMPDMQTVDFCCYDNTETPVTMANLKTMQIEVILSGNALYQQKWAFRRAINAAQSKEELEAIVIEFVYSNFSGQAEGEAAE